MTSLVEIAATVGEFAENKDEARRLRRLKINPFVDAKELVVIDFSGVKYATQSFIHALVGESLQQHKEAALELIEFKGCSPQIKTVVELVVDYTLGGFYSNTDALQKDLPFEEVATSGTSSPSERVEKNSPGGGHSSPPNENNKK